MIEREDWPRSRILLLVFLPDIFFVLRLRLLLFLVPKDRFK